MFRTSKAVRWWKGTCGHEWKAKTADRTVLKNGCPVCNQVFLAFLPKLLALRYTMINGIEVRFDSDREIGLALEIVIPELNMVIESEKKGKQAERIGMVKQHICREHSLRYKNVVDPISSADFYGIDLVQIKVRCSTGDMSLREVTLIILV